METKHTNGQWYVLPHSKQIYIAVQDEIIATINSFRITQGESEANAKLIAAAPELLECLLDIYNDIETWSELFPQQQERILSIIKRITE
jgi:hypothetical protein